MKLVELRRPAAVQKESNLKFKSLPSLPYLRMAKRSSADERTEMDFGISQEKRTNSYKTTDLLWNFGSRMGPQCQHLDVRLSAKLVDGVRVLVSDCASEQEITRGFVIAYHTAWGNPR